MENVLSLAQKVVSKSQQLPNIENVLMEAYGDELVVKATNVEVYFEAKITVELEKDGILLVNPDILLNSIKNNKSDKKITLIHENNELKVEDEKNKIKIKTFNTDDFPQFKKTDEEKNESDKKIWIEGLRSTITFSAQSLIKPELSSVFVYNSDEDIVFVSTDQFRLAEKKIKSKLGDNIKLLIPNKNASLVLKILESSDFDSFYFSTNESQLNIKINNIFLSVRVLDLNFPDYVSIIPKEYKEKLILLKEDFVEALRKSGIFTDKFGKVVLSHKDSILKIKSENSNVGMIEENIDVKADKDLNFSMSFNIKYLQEVLPYINSDSLEILYSGDDKPLLLKALADNSFRYIVMPMRS